MNRCRSKLRFLLNLALLIISGQILYAQESARNQDPGDDWHAEYYFTEGEKYFILEDYAKSLESFQKAYELSPDNPGINYKLAQIYAKSEDISKALYYANKSIVENPENKYYYLLASELHTKNGDFTSAADTYEKMIETVPGTDEYLFELAAIYLYDGKFDHAIKIYNQIETKFGVSEETAIQKQKIYLEQNKFDLAITEIKKLITAFPNEPAYSIRLADMYLNNSRIDDAILLLTKILENNPGYSRARLMLADAFERKGDFESFRKNLILSFEDPSLDPNSKLQILNGYRKDNLSPDNQKFILDLAGTLEKAHPGNATVKVVLGDLNLEYGNNEAALNHYLAALELDQSEYTVWQNIMQLEYQMNRLEDVILHSETAMELFPNQFQPYYFNGLANIRSENYRSGVQAVLESRKRTRDPGFITQCNMLLGDGYHALKEYEKSDQMFESVLSAEPDNDFALNNYSYYLSLRKEKLGRARELSFRLTTRHPNNPTYLDTYAWVLFQLEEYAEAKKIMERVIKSAQANAIHFEHYGDILYKLGKIDAAVEQWLQAKKLNSTSELIDKKIADRKLYE